MPNLLGDDRRRPLKLFLVCLPILFAGSCRSDPPPEIPGPKPIEPSALATDAAEPDDTVDLRLLCAGSEPREPLRYDLQDLSGGRVETSSTSHQDTAGGLQVHGLRKVLEYDDVQLVDGGFRTTVHLVDIDIERVILGGRQRNIRRMRANLRNLVGMSQTGAFDHRGFGVELDDEHRQEDESCIDGEVMRVLLGTLTTEDEILVGHTGASSLVFPVEPVGVGARWTLTAEHEGAQLTTLGNITFELVAREGSRVTLRVETQETGTPQRYRNLDLPDGLEVHLVYGLGDGEMLLRLDTTRIIPWASTTASHTWRSRQELRRGGRTFMSRDDEIRGESTVTPLAAKERADTQHQVDN